MLKFIMHSAEKEEIIAKRKLLEKNELRKSKALRLRLKGEMIQRKRYVMISGPSGEDFF